MSTSYHQGCTISLTELGSQFVSRIYENGNPNRVLPDSPKSAIALGEGAAILAAQNFIDARYKKSGMPRTS